MIAERLRAEILEGDLRPGEWLRQEALSRRHGVSQTPVREALKQLAAEGLVEDVPYRGVRVVDLLRGDVEDLYACRALIESRAARFAAANITDDEIDELEELYLQMRSLPGAGGPETSIASSTGSSTPSSSRQVVAHFLFGNLAQLWSAFPTMLWSNVPPVAEVSAPGRDEPDTAEHAEIRRRISATRSRARRAGGPPPHRGRVHCTARGDGEPEVQRVRSRRRSTPRRTISDRTGTTTVPEGCDF